MKDFWMSQTLSYLHGNNHIPDMMSDNLDDSGALLLVPSKKAENAAGSSTKPINTSKFETPEMIIQSKCIDTY